MKDSERTGLENSQRKERQVMIKNIIMIFAGTFLLYGILVLSAGKVYWLNAWIYTGIFIVYGIVYIIVLKKYNPQLLSERTRSFRKNTKKFDKVFFLCWRPLSLAAFVLAGFDAVRYEWSHMSMIWIIFGIVILIPGFVLSYWAMAVNVFFEPTVRIQEERGHKVCQEGPYKFVRHPGYVGLILFTLGGPFILGSWWVFLPTGIIILLVFFRTALEDRMLQKELSGYKEYTKVTKYRLIPRVW